MAVVEPKAVFFCVAVVVVLDADDDDAVAGTAEPTLGRATGAVAVLDDATDGAVAGLVVDDAVLEGFGKALNFTTATATPV